MGMAMPRTKQVTAGVLLALGLHGISTAVAAIPVTSCVDDSSAGTLRVLLASAANGDSFDASGCSTITLTQGQIPIGANVTIAGASPATTVIDANHNGRAFTSGGNLTLRDLTVTGGRVNTGVVKDFGGCVAAKGSLTLFDSVVTDCVITSDYYTGGGAVAADTVTLTISSVSGNAAYGTAGSSTYAFGGGVHAYSAFYCVNSTVSGNHALANNRGEGGGVFVENGSVYMLGCTVDSNVAQYTGGVLQFLINSSFNVINSTISGNSASAVDGSLYSQAPMVVSNSTIAFNYAQYGCGGIRSLQNTITIYSTIVAHNTEASGSCGEVFSNSPVMGSHNLVTSVSPAVVLPGDTLFSDPRIGPLSNHGGPTRTHALAPLSPAVNAGINSTLLPNTGMPPATDQRGIGFDRSVGATDIGAYERQVNDDEIFSDGFE
jgi:hypothetical protein